MRFAACALLVAVLAGSASAADVPIVNASFEQPAFNPNGFNADGVPGWTAVGSISSWGAFRPTVATWGYAASHLNQLLYINGGTVEQTLPVALEVGITYNLLVDIIRRPGFGTDTYTVQLLAGTTVIASDASTLQPAPGQFATTSLTYTPLAGDPLIGQPLTIRLGGALQVNFDNLRLTAVPAAGPLALLGLGGLIATRRRR
jgi:hypothetical protein